LEVLVALSLLSIVLVGLVGLFMVSLSSSATSDASSIATNLARARLERVRSLPRPAMIVENGTRSEQVMPWGQRRTFTIETSVDESSPPFLDILVTVSWQTAYAPSCRADRSAAPCRGTVVTQSRALETRVWDPEAP
jgi:Tfp pilus assembly protein PilV